MILNYLLFPESHIILFLCVGIFLPSDWGLFARRITSKREWKGHFSLKISLPSLGKNPSPLFSGHRVHIPEVTLPTVWLRASHWPSCVFLLFYNAAVIGTTLWAFNELSHVTMLGTCYIVHKYQLLLLPNNMFMTFHLLYLCWLFSYDKNRANFRSVLQSLEYPVKHNRCSRYIYRN